MSTYQHSGCYARALGDCSPEISDEHYVSEGLLRLIYGRFGEESEIVEGVNLALPFWKPGVSKKLTIGRLKEPILCKAHNSRLSQFDTTSRAMFVAMDRLNESAGDTSRPAASHRVDGDELERWMLKTLCGGLYSGRFPLPPGVSRIGICSPTVWLDMLYNGAKLQDGLGLYYVYRRSDDLVTADRHVFKLKVLLSRDEKIVRGMRLWFFGFQFMLLMRHFTPDDPPDFDDASYRPAGIREIGTGSQVEFTWVDGTGSEEVVVTSLGDPPAE